MRLADNHPHTYHQFYSNMEGSWRARELLDAYRRLETLYSVRMGYWLLWWVHARFRRLYRRADVDCINQRYRIQDLGGKVPSFWSLA